MALAIESCDINPMESKDLLSYSDLDALKAAISGAKTVEEIEQCQKQWEAHHHLASQLASSIKQALKELNAEIKKTEANRKKLESQHSKKKQEEEAAKKKEQEERAKKEIKHKKNGRVFFLDLSGHSEVLRFATAQDRSAAALDFTMPWCLEKSVAFESVLAAEGSKVKATVERWNTAFPKSAVFKESDVVLSALMAAMGAADMNPVMDSLVPKRVSNELPSFLSETENFKLQGESSTYSNFDFEQMFLASVRLQLQGVTKFVMLPADRFIKAALGSDLMQLKNQQTELREKMNNLSAEDLASLKAADCAVHHIELKAFEVLFVPAGWLIGQSSFEGNVSCLKRSCLVGSKAALAAAHQHFEAISTLSLRAQTRTGLKNMMDITEVELTKIGKEA